MPGGVKESIRQAGYNELAKRRALLRTINCRGIRATSERHDRAYTECPTAVSDGFSSPVPFDRRLWEDWNELFTGPLLCHKQTISAKY